MLKMVFDVPAESGGALSILEEYYDRAINSNEKWLFVISKPEFEEKENIKILKYPWVKESWFHRLYFDYIIAPSLVKNHNPDKIISLQNIMIPRSKEFYQSLYVHQSLPFVDYKFGIKDNYKFWIYQNIIGKLIVRSIKKVDHVIVQTEWMKEACIKETNINREKVEIRKPTIDLSIKDYFNKNKENLSRFFYPSSANYYKNHRIIVEATKKLKNNGNHDFKVIFTLNGNENIHIKNLYNIVKKENLPIEFIGKITREEVFNYYTKSVLIFPSYIETFGLPLLEAKLHKSLILASDCPFSKEILDDYDDVYFFDPFDENKLYDIMKDTLKNTINS